ncbi:diguanylate cyclase with GAF sensor [Rhodopirellula maiorica SM1]|uniref:diguanylate cyclase n=1 Tax=Rhodopirellula maiorica SM1 TaxID=1265738 RepID=M5RBP6_9BACT|nr:GGDEF domain-containing protein [Rhodopirellula maiorica]EMI16908.1 diguanylate cyclase with GAF sensor [Rhodopirellula maiorica SM1]
MTNSASISHDSIKAAPISSPQSGVDLTEATLRRQRLVDPSPAEDECCLVQIYPPDVIEGMLLLEEHEFSIGRSPETDLPLFDNSVSRQHAMLIRGQEGYLVRDLGSTNGTFVNEKPVQSDCSLRSGDTIRIGSFLFRFLSAGCVETQYHETVYSAMTRDALTGTMNKRYLMEALNREIARSTRANMELSVVMLDIDHFKSINDTYGHLVGDEVLRTFGIRVGEICRSDDLLARYGGEEFCLLLAATGHEDAREMAERCRHAVADAPFDTAAGALPITASFGFAVLNPSKPKSVSGLLGAADQQLYEAKRSGRNRVCG